MDLQRYSLARVTAPTERIMDLDEAKLHLRVDGDMTDDDALITVLIDAVTDAIEAITHRALIRQTWRASFDRFPYPYPSPYGYVDPLFIQTPSAGGWLAEPIRLPKPNLLSVASVKYQDLNNQQQTLSPSVYVVSTDELPGTISLAYGQSWPNALYLRNSIVIQFDCGYGDNATAIPPAIIQAAKMILSDCYVNRETSVDGVRANVNPTAELLLGPYLYREAA